MIYNKACYAPGAGEGWDVKATESVAFQRVRNYSYPALKAGAGAYFATDMYQGGQQLVDLVLRTAAGRSGPSPRRPTATRRPRSAAMPIPTWSGARSGPSAPATAWAPTTGWRTPAGRA